MADGLVRRARRAVDRRRRGLPDADALLLLPRLPHGAAVLGPAGGWPAALAHWGVASAPPSSADLVVARSARAAAALRAPLVLLPRGARPRALRRAGYEVVTYRVRRLPWGVVLAAPDRAGLALARATWSASGRSGLAGRAAALLRPDSVTVAARGGTWPAAVLAAGLADAPGARGSLDGGCLAVDERDVRRRAVLLVPGPDGAPPVVVKLARSPGEEDRGGREQRALALLPRGVGPAPLGAGREAPGAWSAETALRGRPLSVVLEERPEQARAVLQRVCDRLGDLAAASAHQVDWAGATGTGERGEGDRVVALRGPALPLRALLAELTGVPAVLVHGDLESGHNVVVDEAGRPALLDWETARPSGLPLTDLLPLLLGWLARTGGASTPAEQARRVLDLAAGSGRDGPWALARVREYAARAGVPRADVGRLGLLAWGHQASMRAVRDELLAAAGLPVTPWQSLAELVLPEWRRQVGTTWAALDEPPDGCNTCHAAADDKGAADRRLEL